MQTLTAATIGMFVASVLFQVIGMVLMPLTKGLTAPVYTIVYLAAFVVGVGLLSRIVYSGVDLGLLVPAASAVMPLCAILIGVLFYGEPAALSRVALLVTACVMIAAAGMV